MKVAVICLAYLGDPSGIYLLSKYFAHMDAHLFLHVDAKVPVEPYESLKNEPNVTLLPCRHEIFWGGFNTVRATVSAIEFAQEFGDFDRFVLTTEDSIPLVTPTELARGFASDVDWIAIHAPNPQWVWQRYEKFFFLDSRATSFRYFEVEERSITEGDLSQLDRMRQLAAEGKTELPEIYHGCGWWALTRETIQTILDRHRSDNRLRESFEFSAIPEEQYFHTIIGMAEIDRPRKHFMYVDWDRHDEIKPYIFSEREELRGVRKEHPDLLLVRKVSMHSEEVASFVDELLE